jgi:predicted dinucleotide-binding enzyme
MRKAALSAARTTLRQRSYDTEKTAFPPISSTQTHSNRQSACEISRLAEKTVIDACNPIEDAPPVNGVLPFFTTYNESLMEKLQREFAGAHFVKAFNSVGAASMVNPQFKDGKPTMFICGNSEAAKKTVSGILDQFGWETADMGKAEAARAIEPLCMLWCIPGLVRNQWTHAFKLLTKCPTGS